MGTERSVQTLRFGNGTDRFPNCKANSSKFTEIPRTQGRKIQAINRCLTSGG